MAYASFAGPSYRRARGGSRGQILWAAPRRETSSRRGGPEQPPLQQRLDLVPSFRMDSSATGAVVQNERTVRLVDSRIELSTRRSQHAIFASLSQQRERKA